MHIGQAIRLKLIERQCTVIWFAEQIHCTRTHAYKIFNKRSIDTELLDRICHVLNYNFYNDLAKDVCTIK